MEPLDTSVFDCQPDPANPGWLSWNLVDKTRFNGHAMGHIIVRREGDKGARVRMMPGRQHSNLHNNMHGGAILAIIDVALFGGAAVLIALASRPGEAVNTRTLVLDSAADLSAGVLDRVVVTGRLGEPLDVVTEVLKETKRMVFVRGLVEQDDHLVASFSGTLRKPSRA